MTFGTVRLIGSKVRKGCFPSLSLLVASVVLCGVIVVGTSCKQQASSRGKLRWSSDEIYLNASSSGKSVESNFPFQNMGTTSVEIHSVRTSCGCTVASSEKRTYPPGESGKIKVIFDLQGRKGIQRKIVLVDTTDDQQPRKILRLTVDINSK